MRRSVLTGCTAVGAALAWGLAPAPGDAAAIDQHLFFVAPGQNPFAPGGAVTGSDRWSISAPISRREVPVLRFPPTGPLYAEAGGRSEGVLGLSLGVQYSSGTLDLSYPMRASIAAPDTVQAGSRFSLGLTGAAPANGLFRFGDVVTATRPVDLGGGVRILGGGSSVERVEPFIRTTFPSIAAQLDLSYEQRNSVYVQGCLDAVFDRVCADIGNLRLPSVGPVTQTVASFGPQGAYLLPGTPFEAGVDFGKEIPLLLRPSGEASVSLTPFYPTLTTTGGMSGDNGPLESEESQPILRLTGRLDQLIDDYVLRPAVLPTLTGQVGPVTYTLLEATATLDATVYQEFQYDPALRVRLEFSEPVQFASGSMPFREIELAAGQSLDLRTVRLFPDDIVVRPTYILGGDLRSETGLGVGAGLTVNALRLQAAGLDTGFAFTGSGAGDAPVLPLYTRTFTPQIPAIEGTPFTLDVATPFVQAEMASLSVDRSGSAFADFSLETPGDSLTLRRDGIVIAGDGRLVRGVTSEGFVSFDGDVFERFAGDIFFVADSDLIYQERYGDPQPAPINLGRVFCYACSTGIFSPTDEPTILTLLDGTQVLVNEAPDPMGFVSPGPSRSGGTTLLVSEAGGFTPFTPGDVPPQFAWLFAPSPVPAPGGLLLFAGGLLLLGASSRFLNPRRAA